MQSTALIVIIRAFTLIALATSAALLVDYSSIEVPFCAQAGCMAVRRYGYLASIPVPAFGVAAFIALYAASLLVRVPGVQRLVFSLSATGGLIGAGLIAFQAFKVQSFCVPCVIVDVAALLAGAAGVAGLLGARTRALAPHQTVSSSVAAVRDPLRTWGWIALGALSLSAPLLWTPLREAPPVPEAVRARFQPGKVNVVEFSDFECSHCRELHPRLLALLADHPGRIHHVRMHAPLSGHTHARSAARAAICAEAQGEGDSMAETLFRVEALSDPDLLVYARSLGLDMPAFEQCLADSATDQRIEQEMAILGSTGLLVTPTTFVGTRRIPGAQPDEVFRAALDEAQRGEERRGISASVFSSLLAGLVLAVLLLSRRGSSPRAQVV